MAIKSYVNEQGETRYQAYVNVNVSFGNERPTGKAGEQLSISGNNFFPLNANPSLTKSPVVITSPLFANNLKLVEASGGEYRPVVLSTSTLINLLASKYLKRHHPEEKARRA